MKAYDLLPQYRWRFFHHRNIPFVECWYAWGVAFEVEWSSVFRGIYFKIGCIGFHVGAWKSE